MTTFKEELLANGLVISFSDQSNRYFGDYHRVSLLVTIRCKLSVLTDDDLRDRAFEQFGETLVVEKHLERMGVPSAEVERVRDDLVTNFMRQATTYLARPDYPLRFVEAELNKKRNNRFYA